MLILARHPADDASLTLVIAMKAMKTANLMAHIFAAAKRWSRRCGGGGERARNERLAERASCRDFYGSGIPRPRQSHAS